MILGKKNCILSPPEEKFSKIEENRNNKGSSCFSWMPIREKSFEKKLTKFSVNHCYIILIIC